MDIKEYNLEFEKQEKKKRNKIIKDVEKRTAQGNKDDKKTKK
jgi:hypothetical protein